jgi:hypothetical protein
MNRLWRISNLPLSAFADLEQLPVIEACGSDKDSLEAFGLEVILSDTASPGRAKIRDKNGPVIGDIEIHRK